MTSSARCVCPARHNGPGGSCPNPAAFVGGVCVSCSYQRFTEAGRPHPKPKPFLAPAVKEAMRGQR